VAREKQAQMLCFGEAECLFGIMITTWHICMIRIEHCWTNGAIDLKESMELVEKGGDGGFLNGNYVATLNQINFTKLLNFFALELLIRI
jgi:hypothetical protein